MIIGSSVHRYESVTSTNDVAKELAAEGATEGTVVVAAEQTKGRGSRGRYWVSPPGVNLLASVILRPEIPAERYGELAFVAGVAAARTIRSPFGLEAKIKWPNDIRVGGRKIAGILVEVTHGAAIVGIGVNVNWEDFPAEIAGFATSLKADLEREISLDDVLRPLMSDLEIAYTVYRLCGFDRVLQDWRSYQEPTGSRVTVEAGEDLFTGIARGVDDRGSLLLEMDNGEVEAISAGVIVGQDL